MKQDKLDRILEKISFRIDLKKKEIEYYLSRFKEEGFMDRVKREYYREKLETAYRELLQLEDNYNLIKIGVYDAKEKVNGEIEIIQPRYIQIKLREND